MQFKLLFFLFTILLSFSLPVFSQQEIVRMVYFYPKDRSIDSDNVQKKMNELAEILTSFYKGLVFEKSNDDEYVVHIVKGQHETGDYILNFDRPEDQMLAEIREETGFNLLENLYLVVTNVKAPDGICGVGGIVSISKLQGKIVFYEAKRNSVGICL